MMPQTLTYDWFAIRNGCVVRQCTAPSVSRWLNISTAQVLHERGGESEELWQCLGQKPERFGILPTLLSPGDVRRGIKLFYVT